MSVAQLGRNCPFLLKSFSLACPQTPSSKPTSALLCLCLAFLESPELLISKSVSALPPQSSQMPGSSNLCPGKHHPSLPTLAQQRTLKMFRCAKSPWAHHVDMGRDAANSLSRKPDLRRRWWWCTPLILGHTFNPRSPSLRPACSTE